MNFLNAITTIGNGVTCGFMGDAYQDMQASKACGASLVRRTWWRDSAMVVFGASRQWRAHTPPVQSLHCAWVRSLKASWSLRLLVLLMYVAWRLALDNVNSQRLALRL